MDEHEMTLAKRLDLVRQSELYTPLMYYGNRPNIVIDYVSDIHLLHHMRYYDNDIRKLIRVTTKSLYDSHSSGMQVFLGDISSDKDVSIAFYKQYRLNVMYTQYKKFKCTLLGANDVLAFEQERAKAKYRSANLAKYIAQKSAEFKKLKSEINKFVDYNRVIASKAERENVENYLKSNYYKKRNLPNSVAEMILAATNLYNEIRTLEQCKHKQDEIVATECPSQFTELRDFKFELKRIIGVVILGNHEYVGFINVNDAVAFYKKELEPLGYIVLHNSFVEYNKFIIYGGSGFAKYDERYNANNLVCCKTMEGNRAYEIEQTTLFETEYEVAKNHAIATGKCFICVSHYPVESCLGKFDRETVYFTGHTHKNERIMTCNKALYADNQIGYHNDGRFDGIIRFKKATMDYVKNPYIDLEDGFYQTTPDAYLQFYAYIGEFIGEGKLIRKRCKTGLLYVIKSQGYYGFFVMNKSGLSIANGGITKKIAFNKDIEWAYNNFNIVVRKYLSALEPLRAIQLQISQELKELGFLGDIHGLIIDIDFYNHIIVNPFNGSITFYYSPEFGLVQEFESFQKQLVFMKRTEVLESKTEEFNNSVLSLSDSYLLATIKNDNTPNDMISVSRSSGAYGLSRIVNSLQRLFTGHVLRDFDLKLIENEGEISIYKKESIKQLESS